MFTNSINNNWFIVYWQTKDSSTSKNKAKVFVGKIGMRSFFNEGRLVWEEGGVRGKLNQVNEYMRLVWEEGG